jgi:hypothetical protein
MVRNIDAVFLHDGDSTWIHTVCFYAGTKDFYFPAVGEMFEITVSNLAPAAIARAKDKYIYHELLVNFILATKALRHKE